MGDVTKVGPKMRGFSSVHFHRGHLHVHGYVRDSIYAGVRGMRYLWSTCFYSLGALRGGALRLHFDGHDVRDFPEDFSFPALRRSGEGRSS